MIATIERGSLIIRKSAKAVYSEYMLTEDDTQYIEEYIYEYTNSIDSSRRNAANLKKFGLKYSLYYLKVWNNTEANSIDIPNILDRKNGHSIDHIVPIAFGLKYNIPEKLIGSKENLQVISMRNNLIKGSKITEEAKNILNSWSYDYDKLLTIQTKTKKPLKIYDWMKS